MEVRRKNAFCKEECAVLLCSVTSNSVTAWTVARQAPLSMEFSRQEYWSGLPFPPPRDLPNPEIEPVSLASPALAGGFFTTEPAGRHISSKEHDLAYACSACPQ